MKNGNKAPTDKQRTKRGLEIPVPQRANFDRLINRAANTPVPDNCETNSDRAKTIADTEWYTPPIPRFTSDQNPSMVCVYADPLTNTSWE